jgi:hypothetical protein
MALNFNASGQKLIQILLTASVTGLTLSGALDGQQVTLEFQQNSTGGFTVSSTQLVGLSTPNPAANAVSSQTFQYVALTNTWVNVPQSALVVGSVSNAALAFGSFGTAVQLLPAGRAGTYRVSIYGVVTTTIVTATSWSFALGYTDDKQAQTPTAVTSSTLTAGAEQQIVFTFRSTGATAITITPTAASISAGVIAYSAVLEQLL